MSRLIDADKLLEYGACPNDCNGTTTCAEDYEHLHCPVRVFDIESINDAPTVKAIPLDKVKQAIEEIANKYDDLANAWCEREEGRNEAILEVLEILDKLIAESEG